jgi:glycosyltransferase involved in cell wall biosynthesis
MVKRGIADWWMRVWWPTVDRGEFAGRNVVAHEWLTSAAGSDKVAAELVGVSEAAAVICLSARPEVVLALGIEVPVHQSRIGRWAASGNRWHLLLLLMPVIWGSLRLSGVATVISSSHSLVNSIPAAGRRVCYCHTPVRYGWEWKMERGRLPRWLRPLMRPGSAVLRHWDRRIARRVDVFVANSRFVAERILAAYGRSATVVYPPIDLDQFQLSNEPRSEEFLIAGRLVAYKRADLAVKAATMANLGLVVAGSGPECAALRAVAGPTIRFIDAPTDKELVELMQNARAVLHTGIEDFGMILVEAQACGTPVMARSEGGALETVDPALSGALVGSDRVEEWAGAMASFSPPGTPSGRREWASRFSVEVFRRRMREVLAQ